jgi:predicted nucleic acid-binding protein
MILFLDTNIVIYALESHATWGAPAQTRIATAQAAGDTIREAQYHAFFARSDVQVVAITAAVCDRAARIRAKHNFKSMDALQLAAAVEHGANVFLTADARLGSFTDLTVEVLS